MDIGGLRMPSPRATFYLNLLTDLNPNVRQKAAQAIGQIGDQTCLIRLKEALGREEEADVLSAIREAIAKLES